MKPGERDNPKWRPLAVIGLLALLLRLSVIFLFSEYKNPSVYEHFPIAQNLAQGRGFSTDFLGSQGYTSIEAPAVPFLLASCLRIFGQGDAAYLACELLLALFSSAACVLLALSLIHI